MRFATRTPRPTDTAPPGLTGPARVDRRTHALIPRLRPGDVAVLDHLDLDRGSAHQLVDAGVVAVVNAQAMISGRYANLGPEVLAKAGVQLVDRVGPEVLTLVRDGSPVRIHEGVVYVDGEPVAAGQVLDAELVAAQMAEARDGMAAHLTELHAQHQRVPPARAGPAAARPRAPRHPYVARRPAGCRGGRAGHEHRAQLAGASATCARPAPC